MALTIEQGLQSLGIVLEQVNELREAEAAPDQWLALNEALAESYTQEELADLLVGAVGLISTIARLAAQ